MSSFFRDKISQYSDKIYYSVFGEDVFISYSRSDGDRYAKALFNELTKNQKFTCYIDELGTEAGAEIGAALKRKIRTCSVFVLLGSPHAHLSKAIGDEILTFMSVRKNRTRLIPIDFGGQIRKAVSDENLRKNINWFEMVGGIDAEFEELKSLKSGEISESVIDRIKGVKGYVKQTDRIRKARNGMLSGIGLFLLLSLGLGIFAWITVGQANEAATRLKETRDEIVQINKEKADAEEAKKKALDDAKEAEIKRADAEQKMGDALKLQEQAEEKAEKATLQAAQAEEKRKNAERLEKEAKEARAKAEKEAAKQSAIARAGELANEANASLAENRPAKLIESFKDSKAANNLVEENRLSLTEPISVFRKALSITPTRTAQFSQNLKIACKNGVLSPNHLYLACLNDRKVEVFQVSDFKKTGEFTFEDEFRKIEKNTEDIVTEKLIPEIAIDNLNVSDNGNLVAVTVETRYFVENEDGEKEAADGEIYPSEYEIYVKNRKEKTLFSQEKTETLFSQKGKVNSLSADGRFLVFSDSGKDDDGITIWSLNLLHLKSGQIKTLGKDLSILKGSFSPDCKYFYVLDQDFKRSAVTLIHRFMIEVQGESADSVLPTHKSLNLREQPLKVTELAMKIVEVGFGEITDIALNNEGDKIALKTNGISIWNIELSPKLEVLIPQSSFAGFNSFFFIKEEIPYGYKESLITTGLDEKAIKTEIWETTGYKISEDSNSGDFSGQGFSEKHPQLELRMDNTKSFVDIVRKDNSALVDRIEFGEVIQRVVISKDGKEIITESFADNESHKIMVENDGGDDLNYRKWKIGFSYLDKIAREKLKHFQQEKEK